MTAGVKAATAVVATCVALALCARWIASDEGPALFAVGPTSQDLALRLASPGTAGRPLGADALGRDVLARVVHGLRTSLGTAVAAAALTFALGLALGAAAGVGRRGPARAFGAALGAVLDGGAALPPIFVAAAAQAALRPGPLGLVLLLGLSRTPFVAQLVRQEARRVAPLPFVVAARAAGVSRLRVFLRHVVPHAATPALVAAAFAIPGNVVAEASLSFLGIGLPEPTASLGALLRDGRQAVPYASHLVWIPGVVVAALALSFQTLADALRRARGAGA